MSYNLIFTPTYVIFGILVLAALIQFYFILSIQFRICFYKNSINPKEEGISVIVCAWNEHENLQELVPLLLKQAYEKFEIIIVNDRSSDGTYDYLRELSYNSTLLRTVTIEETPEGMSAKKYAITLGVKSAKYDRLLFTDADARPFDEKWIQTISDNFQETDLLLGFSGYEKRRGFLNLFVRFETIQTALTYFSFAKFSKPYMGIGRNIAYRKSLFLENKGFQPYMDVIGGDDDLFVNKVATRKNTSIVLEKQSQTFTFAKTTWKKWYIQKTRHLSVSKFYKIGDILKLYFLFISGFIMWGFVFMYFFDIFLFYIVAALFGVRMILQLVMYFLFTKKLGTKFEWYLVPFLEIFYFWLYIILTPISLNRKKIRWK